MVQCGGEHKDEFFLQSRFSHCLIHIRVLCGPARFELCLHCAPNIHGRQTDLHGNQRWRFDVKSPHDPQYVTQQKYPETQVPSAAMRRPDQARCRDGDDHGGPLKQVYRVHAACLLSDWIPRPVTTRYTVRQNRLAHEQRNQDDDGDGDAEK
jgi:hypothetical protein